MWFANPQPFTLTLIVLVSGLSTSGPFPEIAFPKSPIVLGARSYEEIVSPRLISLSSLIDQADKYHRQLVKVHGVIKQPELHLDDTQLRLNFVFRLTRGTSSITVFGIFDRTQGPPPIALDNPVEVVGTFFKERELHDATVFYTLEAISVTLYPPMEPDRA